MALSLAAADVHPRHSAHPAGRRGADRQGHRVDDLPPRARAAAAPGAQPHHSDVGAARDPDRLRPSVRRSRVRGHAGVRRQPLPPDSPRGVRRRAGHPGHGAPDHSRTARRESDVPRDYLQRRSRTARRATSSRACFTESSPIEPSMPGTSSPGGWRDVFLADTSQPGQTTVYFAKEGRLLVDREKKIGRAGADRRDVAHDVGREARRVRGRRLRQHAHSPRSGHGVPQHHAVEDGTRDEHRGAQGQHRRRRAR